MKENKLLRAARFVSVVALAAASIAQAPLAHAAGSIPNKTLIYCSEGSPAGFDPAQYTTGTDFTANTFTVYNCLVEFERGGTKVEPGLAEKWDISPDGLTYTFHLRHGVKYQTTSFFKPTREFNADDVVFTFQRMLDPNQPFRKAYNVAFPNGMEITLWAMPVSRPYNPNARLMAEMIQADWAKIGVKANIVSYEWGEYMKRGHAGEHDAMLVGWTGDNGDPDNWLGTLLGCDAVKGSNFSKWCYKPFDELVVKGRTTSDLAQRTKFYTQAQEIFGQQLPFSPIAHSTVYQPISKKVQGMKIEPLGYVCFDGVSVQ